MLAPKKARTNTDSTRRAQPNELAPLVKKREKVSGFVKFRQVSSGFYPVVNWNGVVFRIQFALICKVWFLCISTLTNGSRQQSANRRVYDGRTTAQISDSWYKNTRCGNILSAVSLVTHHYFLTRYSSAPKKAESNIRAHLSALW